MQHIRAAPRMRGFSRDTIRSRLPLSCGRSVQFMAVHDLAIDARRRMLVGSMAGHAIHEAARDSGRASVLVFAAHDFPNSALSD